ncbi:MAG: aminopeptidase P family protein [Chloroflexi bacterium]|nr:aminopeptidase P family protein [Chloroflexota bacterium]
MPIDATVFRSRRDRAAQRARSRDLAALLVTPGSDLAYLTGHRIHESERLTCLVLTADGSATLVVPELEAPRARAAAPGLELRLWSETEDPIAAAAALVPRGRAIAVGERMWASFLLRLQATLPDRTFCPAAPVVAPLRAIKDASELAALRAVAQSADRAYTRVRELVFEGRTEREVGADIAALLGEEGHDEVTFTIVGSGPNGASPHHNAGERRIARGDAIVLDFGGTMAWYCSDITRTVHVGPPSAETVRVHDAVRKAQEAGYKAAREGVAAQDVDAAARTVIDEAGYGTYFIHRLGHGIGLDGHEDPYLVRGNSEPLVPGMAFSIEPGIYLPGKFGVRIEDIAVLNDKGVAEPLNEVDRSLAVVS